MAIKNSAAHAVDILLSDFMCLAAVERAVITADMTSDMRLVQALLEGMYRRGRQASAVIIPRAFPSEGAGADVGITDACRAAIMNTDLWIDMTFPYMAGSGPHDEVMHAGKARYLLLGDANLDSFTRLFGDIELDRYFEAQAEFDKTFGQEGCALPHHLSQGVRLQLRVGEADLRETSPRDQARHVHHPRRLLDWERIPRPSRAASCLARCFINPTRCFRNPSSLTSTAPFKASRVPARSH